MNNSKDIVPSVDSSKKEKLETLATTQEHGVALLDLATNLSPEAKETLANALVRLENQTNKMSFFVFLGKVVEQMWDMPNEEKEKLFEFRQGGGSNYGEEALKFVESYLS